VKVQRAATRFPRDLARSLPLRVISRSFHLCLRAKKHDNSIPSTRFLGESPKIRQRTWRPPAGFRVAVRRLTNQHDNHKLRWQSYPSGIETARRAATAIAANLARKNLSTPRCEIGGDRRAGETCDSNPHSRERRTMFLSPLILQISTRARRDCILEMILQSARCARTAQRDTSPRREERREGGCVSRDQLPPSESYRW